ncbi:hypothetical protein K2Z83_11945 [Oscillochloris sp. ZM17-4]|uniref:hypothetical protein n=1 Tax=Oscillochloris sp. ZM17-4 TaxID=2866714 RepID=UPI001C736377|nr:hypothetical protein [Oscillochloris sp. ZM17-4]MBX0328388.1 hypothetical protein [Oscillochloris sp. ZM17-4]
MTLVVSDLANDSYELHTALDTLGIDPRIEVRRMDELSPRQAAALLDEGREV